MKFKFKPEDFESSNWMSAIPGQPSELSKRMCEKANAKLAAYLETLPKVYCHEEMAFGDNWTYEIAPQVIKKWKLKITKEARLWGVKEIK